jgi:hypothetical protein
MKKTLVLAGALLLAWSFRGWAADKKEFAKLTEDLIETFKSATKVLTSIKDEATAKAAAPKLKEIGEKLRNLRKKAQDLGQPTKEQKEELKKEYKEKMEEAQKSLKKELQRVKKVPGGKEALKALDEKKADGSNKDSGSAK